MGPDPRCCCPILLILHAARPIGIPKQLPAFQDAELRLLQTDRQTRHFISLMCICRLIMLFRAPLREVSVKGKCVHSKCELHVGIMKLLNSQHIGKVGVLTAVLLKVQVLWDAKLCRWLSGSWRVEGLWFLRNVGNCKSNATALQSRHSFLHGVLWLWNKFGGGTLCSTTDV